MKVSESGELVLLDDTPVISNRFRRFAAGEEIGRDHLGFALNVQEIRNGILVPKYYDPGIDAELKRLSETHDLVTIGSLITSKVLSIGTGVEVGKMAYGTGSIPFIRTSDISNWEIKSDFKHGVSQEIYESERESAEIAPGDILMVRDGTYLIGATAIVTESDLPMLFQSHILRIRVLDKSRLDPWLLFACLNAPIVKRQIKAKQFTQDIIDTLGKRINEVILPIPKDKEFGNKMARETERVILTRVELRNQAKQIALQIEGIDNPEEEEIQEILQDL